MIDSFNKYFEDVDLIGDNIANLLDPKYKFSYLNFKSIITI